MNSCTLADQNFQLNAHQYPTWASLACDYLAMMASSVSSDGAVESVNCGGSTVRCLFYSG